MKLILCLKCYDVFKLALTRRTCECGDSAGAYKADGWYAWFEGKNAVPLGMANNSILKAIVDRGKIEAWVFEEGYERFERRRKK